MPGAITPPTYSPAGDTTSKLVEVPKSTTTTGAPYRSLGSDGVHDPIRSDLAWIVVADGDPGLHARPDDEERSVRPLPRELLPLADEHRHGAHQADPVDALEVEKPAKKHAELVGSARALGREPPVIRELAVAVLAEHRLRVADVDRQEHRGSESERACIWTAMRPQCGRLQGFPASGICTRRFTMLGVRGVRVGRRCSAGGAATS